jgi:hypothetical protein
MGPISDTTFRIAAATDIASTLCPWPESQLPALKHKHVLVTFWVDY